METDAAYAIAEAFRRQRRHGKMNIAAPHCHIVANPAHPDVWDANHADDVTAQTEAEIDAAFAAMDKHLGQYFVARDPHRLSLRPTHFSPVSRSTTSRSAPSRSRWR